MAMKDVGPSLGPQLMDKIGDVIRFIHKDAITAFAGADPGVNDSGDYSQNFQTQFDRAEKNSLPDHEYTD